MSSKNYEYLKKWRHTTKIRMVQSMGSKCQCCGYNKCIAALEFHHIDSLDKEISFGLSNRSSWEEISNELKKCILVCSNCHREIHHGNLKIPSCFQQYDENLIEEQYKVKIKEQIKDKICKSCNNRYTPCSKNQQFCSNKCVGESKRFVMRPNKLTLEKLIKEHTWVDLGKKFGVSDNTVRKWAKHYKLIE